MRMHMDAYSPVRCLLRHIADLTPFLCITDVYRCQRMRIYGSFVPLPLLLLRRGLGGRP